MNSLDRPQAPLRVVQWATGNIGMRSLRAVIEHPDLELVGLLVYDDAKAGRDAGELCGLGPVGVTATRDVGDILDLHADCVVHMARQCDFDVLAQVLRSGTNVVTTRGEFHHPPSMEPSRRTQIEDACEQGNSSIHSTGSSPGFISEAVPLTLLSLQRRLDHLVIDEFADLSQRNSPELLFDLMGYGADPTGFGPERWAHGATSFGPTLRALAEAVGLPLDTVDATGAVAAARHDVTIAAGVIRAGTVAAQRMTVTGWRRDQALLRFRATWYCTDDLDAEWDLHPTGWRVQVVGDTPLDVGIRFDVPLARMGELSPGLTAHRAVNAVPALCAASPGIRTTAELAQVVPVLGR